jgi:hypothetical protein
MPTDPAWGTAIVANGLNPMVLKLSDHVTECIARAADTERRAREATDSQLRQDLLDIAKRWRHLAESYQFVESLDRFIVEQKSQRVSKSA